MLSKYIVLAVAVMASAVSAQNKCQAQAVFDRCISDREDIIGKECNSRDDPAVYNHCMCKNHKAKVECYINCPNDITKGTVENQVVAYCISAGGEKDPNAPTGSVISASPSSTASPTEDDDEASPSGGADETGSAPEGSGTAAPGDVEENDEGAAGNVVARVGAALGAGAAVAAWIL